MQQDQIPFWPSLQRLTQLQLHLREVLQTSAAAQSTPGSLLTPLWNAIYLEVQQLEQQTRCFSQLLHSPGPSASAKQDLQEKRATHSSVEHWQFTSQQLEHVFQLADRLSLNQHLAAQLYLAGLEYAGSVNRLPVDASVLLFYRVRLLCLQCFHDMLLIAHDPQWASWPLGQGMRELMGKWLGAKVHSIGFFEHLVQLIPKLSNDVFSLVIEEKLGVETAPQHAAQQNLTLIGAYQRLITQEQEKLHAAMGIATMEERHMICRILALICWNDAQHFMILRAADAKLLADTLSKWTALSDPALPLIVTSFVALCDHSVESSMIQGRSTTPSMSFSASTSITGWRDEALTRAKTILKECDPLIKDVSKWSNSGIHSALLMHWVVIVRKLADKLPAIAREYNLTQQKTEELVEQCINNNAFQFMKQTMLPFVTLEDSNEYLTLSDLEGTLFSADTDDYARSMITTQLQSLVLFLTTKTIDLIRRLKMRDEDTPTQSSAPRFHRSARELSASQSKTAPPVKPRKDLESFLELISMIYKNRENAGLDILDPRRRSFLKLIYDDRLPLSSKRAYFLMLASLATGEQASQSVYDMLSSFSSSLSWDWIMKGIDWYINEFNQLSDRGISPEINPEDLFLIEALIAVIRNVAKYSPTARVTLHETYDAVRRLFRLFSTRVPKELKAPLLDTIRVFCKIPPFAAITPQSMGIVWLVWSMLEAAQVVPKSLQGGILYDLEMIESKDEMYPETKSFIALINTLIYPQRSMTINFDHVADLKTSTRPFPVPDTLLEYPPDESQPVIVRYTQYIIQEVLLKSNSRSYRYPAERWSIFCQCLEFIEQSLYGFDLSSVESIISAVDVVAQQQSAGLSPAATNSVDYQNALAQLRFLTAHPGFHILGKLLSGSSLLTGIFQLLEISVETLNKNMNQSPFMTQAVLHSLRILLRVFDVQDLYLRHLVPTLRRSTDSLLKKSVSTTHVTVLEEMLARSPKIIVNVANYINITDVDELALLSVKILTFLAQSSFLCNSTSTITLETQLGATIKRNFAPGNRLVRILGQSEEADRIIAGYVYRLSVEDPGVIDESADLLPNSREFDFNSSKRTLANPIRLAIMNLLLNTVTMKSPNVSQLLLGFKVDGEIRDTYFRHPRDWTINTQKTCFFSLLELLNDGIISDENIGTPQLDQDGNYINISFSDLPANLRHPELFFKALELLHRLCEDPDTCNPTMRYLRYGEDFFYRQISALHPEIVGSKADGEYGPQLGAIVHAQLQQRAWTMKLVTLEMHLSALNNEKRHGQRLVQLLLSGDTMNPTENDTFEEGYSKILQLLDAACGIYPPTMSAHDFLMSQKYFKNIQIHHCRSVDQSGCEAFDVKALHSVLSNVFMQLEQAGVLRNPQLHDDAQSEMENILHFFISYNNANAMLYSRSQYIKSWKELAEVMLTHLYDQISISTREQILIGLINSVLEKMTSNSLHITDREALSEILLVSLSKLRQDRPYIEVSRTISSTHSLGSGFSSSWSIPVEQLLLFFERILQCITNKDGSVIMRGNLYTALVNYLQYTQPSEYEKQHFLRHSQNQDANDTNGASSTRATINSLDETNLYAQQIMSTQRVQIKQGNLEVFNKYLDSAMAVLCADASGEESGVWKTMALTALDSLAILAQLDHKRGGNNFLEYLKRRNFLRFFIDELRTVDDAQLDEILAHDPEILTPLYVYEAKMSLFLRIASLNSGAEALLDNRLIETLAECRFFRHRDENMSVLKVLSEGAVDRFHHCQYPVLCVINSILSALGKEHSSIIKKVAFFVNSQRVPFLEILRDKLSTSHVTLSSLLQLNELSKLLYFVSSERKLLEVMIPESFHDLLMHTLIRLCEPERWIDRLQPQSESETRLANTLFKPVFEVSWLASGSTKSHLSRNPYAESLLAKKAIQISHSCMRSILLYCCDVTEMYFRVSTKDSLLLKPLFSPQSINAWNRRGQSDTDMLTNQPPIGILVIYLKSCINSAEEGILLHKKSKHGFHDMQDLNPADVDELSFSMLPYSSTEKKSYSIELSLAEKQQLALVEIERRKVQLSQDVAQLLLQVESLLVIIYRHLQFYFEQFIGAVERSKSSILASEKRTMTMDVDSLHRLSHDINAQLRPELHRIENLELSKDLLGPSFRSRANFLLMVIRRMSELLSLSLPNETESDMEARTNNQMIY